MKWSSNRLHIYAFIISIIFLTNCGQGMVGLLEKGNELEIIINNTTDIVEAPTFNYSSGSYSHDISVEISSITVGADIYFTLDNTHPGSMSNIYTHAIQVAGNGNNTIIRAIAGWCRYRQRAGRSATVTMAPRVDGGYSV